MNAARVVALCCALAGAAARADGPAYSYVEYTQGTAKLQSDLKGPAKFGVLTLPVGDQWFLSARGRSIEARFDNPANGREAREGGSAELGLHGTRGPAHAFASVGYARAKRRFTPPGGAPSEDRAETATAAAGVRWLVAPYVELDLSGSWGFKDLLGASLNAGLLVRLVPHVWLTAAYSAAPFSDQSQFSAGVRLALADSTPLYRPPPGVRRADAAEADSGEEAQGEALAPGQTVVALRRLRLQLRPAFGAAEDFVEAGETITLVEPKTNEFGNWWKVSVGGRGSPDRKEGWIRESELAREVEKTPWP